MSKASGAQNRKRKKTEENMVKSLPKISAFLRPVPKEDFPSRATFTTAASASHSARQVFWDSEAAPVEETVAPADETAAPADETAAPVEETAAPYSPITQTFELELAEEQGKVKLKIIHILCVY